MTGNVQAVSQVGKTVGDKYRLIRVLGVGGMGVVYEAQHLVTQRKVALKLLHQWVAESSPAAATRFLREAQAAASIGHPALVDVFDAGQLPDGSLFLVFELLDGEDLESALNDGELRAHDVVAIVCDVLEGLAAAHTRGFIHRDIKPANVFLSRAHSGERQVKLLDFGISKRDDGREGFSSITAHGSIVGTLEYMSPEQASAEVIDNRSDLWAIGALFHRALAGRPPFVADSQLELVKAILIAPVPSLKDVRPDLPDRLVQIVDRALIRDREERWPTASAMREALLEVDRAALPAKLPPQYDAWNATPEHEVRDEPTQKAVRPERTEIRSREAEATEIAYVPLIAVEDSEDRVPVVEVSSLAASPPPVIEERDRETLIVSDRISRLSPEKAPETAPKKGGRYLLASGVLLTAATIALFVTFSDPPQAAPSLMEPPPMAETLLPAPETVEIAETAQIENAEETAEIAPAPEKDVVDAVAPQVEREPPVEKKEKRRAKKKVEKKKSEPLREVSKEPAREKEPEEEGEFFYKSMEDGP